MRRLTVKFSRRRRGPARTGDRAIATELIDAFIERGTADIVES